MISTSELAAIKVIKIEPGKVEKQKSCCKQKCIMGA